MGVRQAAWQGATQVSGLSFQKLEPPTAPRSTFTKHEVCWVRNAHVPEEKQGSGRRADLSGSPASHVPAALNRASSAGLPACGRHTVLLTHLLLKVSIWHPTPLGAPGTLSAVDTLLLSPHVTVPAVASGAALAPREALGLLLVSR